MTEHPENRHERVSLEEWLATLPPLTARQKQILAQTRAEIDASFGDGVSEPGEGGSETGRPG